MRHFFIVLVLLVIPVVPILSQTTIKEKAKAHLQEMHEVVSFTSDQKDLILVIFEDFLTDREALDPNDFSDKKDYLNAKVALAVDARAEIVSLMSADQKALWESYELSKRAEFDAAQSQIDHAARYNALTQEP